MDEIATHPDLSLAKKKKKESFLHTGSLRRRGMFEAFAKQSTTFQLVARSMLLKLCTSLTDVTRVQKTASGALPKSSVGF